MSLNVSIIDVGNVPNVFKLPRHQNVQMWSRISNQPLLLLKVRVMKSRSVVSRTFHVSCLLRSVTSRVSDPDPVILPGSGSEFCFLNFSGIGSGISIKIRIRTLGKKEFRKCSKSHLNQYQTESETLVTSKGHYIHICSY